MKKDRTCEYCNIIFENEEGRVFSNHVRWCKKNTSNGDKGISTVANSLRSAFKKKSIKRYGDFETFIVVCSTCNKSFNVIEGNKVHPLKSQYFCSRSCANSRGPRSESFKEKVLKKWKSKSKLDLLDIQAKRSSNIDIPKEKIYQEKKCPGCGNMFYVYHKNAKISCSRSCFLLPFKIERQGTLRDYRGMCTFKFALRDFPTSFDFSLVEQNGWYTAKNRGNNLNGVSRDHIVSVQYGFDNNIDPLIISHPANCPLLRHNDNVSKGKKSNMTIEELVLKIQEWDDRYRR